jgi:hypothetical protein
MSGFRTLFYCLLIVGISGLVATSVARAEKRLALVVGIDKYPNLTPNSQLQKAVNDARAVSGALRDIGFNVRTLENAQRAQMSEAFGNLEQSIAPGDTVFIYFAGHGVEFAGANYLLPGDIPSPVDAQGRRLPPRAFRDSSFNAAEVLSSFQDRGAGAVIAVFDACREPFDDEGKRSLGMGRGGLGEMQPTAGMFIMFSAGVKQTALDRISNDDSNPNSVFTRNLVPLLKVPGQSLVRMAKELQPNVSKLAMTVNHVQTPAYYDQIMGDFYLVPPGDGAAGRGFDRVTNAQPSAPLPVPTPAPPPDPCAGALEHWKSVESIGRKEAFEAHVARFPNCPYAELARMRIAMLAAPPPPPAPPPAPAPAPTPVVGRADDQIVSPSICSGTGSLWDMDGSSVVLKADASERKFYFCRPDGSASTEGARPGALLFTGRRSGNRYNGTAYVHAGNCGAFPYSVSGNVFNGDQGVTLSGARPVIDMSTCKVSSSRETQLTLNYKQLVR